MNTETNNTLLSDEETIKILKAISIKIDVANAQILNLGLLVEYLYEKLDENKIDLQVDSFNAWAEERHKQIQEQAESMVKEGVLEEMKAELEKTVGINFEESD